jgi:Tol biopolymer transport system component
MSTPQSIAHYRITGKLGQGGMGEVYRATDTKLGREVAIKVLPADVAADAGRMARFEREAQLLAALNHPNIAAIYGIEQGALIMELVEGDDLKGPLPVDTALNYARQIAEGLEAAHEKGIIHRDLKPANIKVTPSGQVKLLDFGLAKATEESSSIASQSPTMSPTLSLAMTQAGVILGTAAYMSPEQARAKPVDKRADIWAFGVVLYEMLTGSMLFGGGDTVTDSLAAVITREPDWEALPKDTPPRIRRLMERCLRKDPKLRMRDIGEARLIIDEAEPAAVAVAPVVERRLPWLPWAVAGLFAVAAAVVAGAVWLKPKPVDVGAARFPLALPEGASEAGSPAAAQAVPSPDGHYIAFIARDKVSGKENLWVRPLGSLAAHKLDKTENANFPFWSPDGQFIAFFADDKLKRIPAAGGSPQTLCEAKTVGGGSRASGDGGAWNRESVIVFAPGGRELMRIPAAGGIPTPATTLGQQDRSHSWPQFLADGRHLLYFVHGKDSAQRGLYVQELGSSQRTLVLKNTVRAAWSPPGYLLFVREGTLFAQRMNPKSYQLEGEAIPVAEEVSANEGNGRAAFAVSENGVLVYRGGVLNRLRQLAWYDREGKRLEGVGKPGEYMSVALSPDEKSAAVVVGSATRSADTWAMDLASGVLTRMTMDSESSTLMGQPWSPDSQRLAVNRVGTGGIIELTVASQKTRVLVQNTLYAQDWSRDGGSLLCTDRENHRLIVLPLTGEIKPRTVLDTAYLKRMFRFSPDGKWVAYASNESGRFEVFVAAFPSFAEKRQVSSAGGVLPSWRKDGKEIFFQADFTLMSAEIKTGSRIEAGVPRPLFRLPSAFLRGVGVAAAGDGKRFLVVEEGQQNQEAQVLVVVNWMAELRQ